jgi:hypothetical protein
MVVRAGSHPVTPSEGGFQEATAAAEALRRFGSLVANQKIAAIEADSKAGRPYNRGNDDYATFRTASRVLFAVGGAALVGGGWLIWSSRPPAASEPVASVAPVLLERGGGIVVAGAF